MTQHRCPNLTPATRESVLRQYADGVPLREIAAAVGASVQTVWMVAKRGGLVDGDRDRGPRRKERMETRDREPTAAQVEAVIAEQMAEPLPAWWWKELEREQQRPAGIRFRGGRDTHEIRPGYPRSPWGDRCPLLPLFGRPGVNVGTPAFCDADAWLRGEEGLALLAAGVRVRAETADGGATVTLTWAGGEVTFDRRPKAVRAYKPRQADPTPRQATAKRFIEAGRRLAARA